MPIFLGIPIVDQHNFEAALPEPAVLDQRAADLARPDHGDSIGAAQSQDLAQPGEQLRHGVPEPAFAERAEEGEILADLRRRGATAGGQLLGTDGGHALQREILQESEVKREASDG